MLQNCGMINSILPGSATSARHRRSRPSARRWLCRGNHLRLEPIVQRLPSCQGQISRWSEHAASNVGGDWGTEPWWQTVLGCMFLALIFGFALLVT
jgi:hypothetical protein